VVEGGGLENRCAGLTRTVGSNPTLSAKHKGLRDCGALFYFAEIGQPSLDEITAKKLYGVSEISKTILPAISLFRFVYSTICPGSNYAKR
jgi:hypothetical protein